MAEHYLTISYADDLPLTLKTKPERSQAEAGLLLAVKLYDLSVRPRLDARWPGSQYSVMTESGLDLSPLRRAADALELAPEVLARHRGVVEEHRLLRDGVIRRFEFAFELAWKT